MKLRARIIISILAVLLLCLLISEAHGTTYTLIMNSNTQTVNETLGYALTEQNTTTSTYDTTTGAALQNLTHGIRVFTVDEDGNETEVTSGSPVALVTRTNAGEGIQSSTWTCVVANNSIFDALMIRVYRRWATGSWSLRVTFITTPLNAMLTNSTWTVYYWTSYWGGTPDGTFRWGNTTHYSHIQNLELTTYTTWEWMNEYLMQGNFVRFILTPYVNPLGEFAYGIFMLTIVLPLYNRTENISYVAAVFIIFGGATGIFTMLIPLAALNIAYGLLVLGIGILFVQLILKARQH